MSLDYVVLIVGMAGVVRVLGRVVAGWFEQVVARPRRLPPRGWRIY